MGRSTFKCSADAPVRLLRAQTSAVLLPVYGLAHSQRAQACPEGRLIGRNDRLSDEPLDEIDHLAGALKCRATNEDGLSFRQVHPQGQAERLLPRGCRATLKRPIADIVEADDFKSGSRVEVPQALGLIPLRKTGR